MNVVLLIFLCFIFTISIQETNNAHTSSLMSLYYFSETTFLNLEGNSNNFSLNLNLKEEMNLEKLKREFGAQVYLRNKTLRTHFFAAPNGELKYQGWVKSKEQIRSTDKLNGEFSKFGNVLKQENASFERLSVNVQVSSDPIFLRNLLINLYRSSNRKFMKNESYFEEKTLITENFKNILLSKDSKGSFAYEPTMEQLFDDFFVKQISETLFKNKNVWNQSIQVLKDILISYEYELPEYALDITPILFHFKKEDPLVKKWIHRTGEFITFNECNGDIQVCIRRAVGLVKATLLYGHFISDSLVSQVSFVEKSVIQEIRKKLIQNRPIIFKYLLYHPELCPPMKYVQKLMKWYSEKEEVIIGRIPPLSHGISPIIIPGNNIVWHQRMEHRFNIQSKFNFALINHNVVDYLDNFWKVYSFVEKIYPNHFIKTKLLVDILPIGVKHLTADIITNILKKEFPNGWIMKNIFKNAQNSPFISHENLKELFLQEHEIHNLDNLITKKLSNCHFEVEDNYYLDIKQFFMNISQIFVQEFISNESIQYVTCIALKCRTDDSFSTMGSENSSLIDFVDDFLDSLPNEALKYTTFNMEISHSKGNNLKFSNFIIGGNYWRYHHVEFDAFQHHNSLITIAMEDEKIKMLSEEESIQLIHQWNKGVDPSRYILLQDRIINKDHQLHQVDFSKIDKVTNFQSKKFQSIKNALDFLYINHTMFLEDLHPWNFINIIKHLVINKNRYPLEYYPPIEKSLQILKQEKIRKKIVAAYMKEMDYFLEDLPCHVDKNKLKLSDKETQILASLLFRKLDELIDLMVLNIDHSEFSEKISKFFELFFYQDLKSWNTMVIGNIDILNVTHFKYLFDEFKLSKSDTEFKEMVLSLKDAFIFFRALTRTGFNFPGFDFNILSKIWLPSIRETYFYFMKSPHLLENLSNRNTFFSLIQLVNQIILETSDDSLYRLKKESYKYEYEFLKFGGSFVLKFHEMNLLAEIIQSLVVLGGMEDENLIYFIKSSKNFIIELQTKEGYWVDEVGINIEKMNKAMRGLISKTPREYNNHFGKLVFQNNFVEKLQMIGLWKKIAFELPTFPKISKIVSKSLSFFSLNEDEYSTEIKVFGSQILSTLEIQKNSKNI
jgi:hypothetical protein